MAVRFALTFCACCLASSGALHAPALATITRSVMPVCMPMQRAQRCDRPPAMCEYSTKVKMTAEVRAPFRQARIFFLYPATIAAASIASYVSVLRLVGQKDAMADSGNLLVNLGIITAAVFCLRADLKGRSELLQEVAIELKEARPPEGSPSAAAAIAGADDGAGVLSDADPSARAMRSASGFGKKKKSKRA